MATLAILLTGGRSRRMGGTHKPAMRIGAESMIDRVARTVRGADPAARLVVAGSAEGVTGTHAVEVVREDPPFSGPLAGLAAGVRAAAPDPDRIVVVLGGDMPFVSPDLISRLIDEVLGGAEAAGCHDATGHLQYLCTAWRDEALRARLSALEPVENRPLRALYDGVDVRIVDADGDEVRDIDTPDDYARSLVTSDGRAIPTALVDAALATGRLTADDLVAVLDAARAVKHAGSDANPVVAAFLAGTLPDPTRSALDAIVAIARDADA
ncbi:molybdenum cofactor guanylyltransferase [Microbacterium suaedae]|uniref:molybdenum cofactor guanylyltransferase n=1 Tax=Microbacterium suaedae TaxID=2067813 RepID=UPI000DAEE518|nr:molybdenum cofactor guanylyltransferase [Microbacterium suaedae]